MANRDIPEPRKTWLVCNAASGSNDDASVAELKEALEQAGFHVERTIRFPDEDAPAPEALDEAGVTLLVTFGGDGTTHSVVARAEGWNGPVLVLPGGTMNLLAKRMHGDVPVADIVGRLEGADLRTRRPTVIRSRHGIGLTGVLAGPGTVWNEVREAMRAVNILEFVATTREAISQSANGPRVFCAQADCGREDGYAAITVNPRDDGLEANGFYAESLADYAGQGIALLNRNFRDGPHDPLGKHERLKLVCPEGEPMGLLIDGEPFDGGTEEEFYLATCEVDLVTTLDAS
ncbi:diacylglycerol/lipid kinase family protein [Novosphingobium aerophilum]|uniref:diacylglycerol/lipid kinase family protein n=1 Tax=Novosphingobium TaxID=165696 RepID=UPI002D79B6E3|nr:diacylglycerol kinase family protein [Novosphingobium sp. RL4]WRT93256.1 diacylglycerol kinase family protein [Novosphingobium sp. RL4]